MPGRLAGFAVVVLAGFAVVVLAGFAVVVLAAIAVTLLLFARQAVRRIARGIRRY